MRRLGGDPGAMLKRYHIAPASLQYEDALLSLRAVVHLLEASAAATGCADFGLRLSHSQDISVLGPLAIVMQNAPTVESAMDYASRYLFVHSPGLVLTLHEHSPVATQSAEVRMEIRLARQPPQRQTMDLCLADVHHMLRMLAADRYVLHAVTLPHTPGAPLSVYKRFFGAPILVDQPHGGLHIGRETLQASLQGVDHHLRQIAENHLSQHFRLPNQSLSGRVRQAVRSTLGTPPGNKTAIAALLGMHPRTLQRHLLDERTSFDAIREEVRKETALRYLRETRIPLAQLAGLLGFSEQSAMTRSCRRWFGVPPSALRRQIADRDPHIDAWID